MAWGQVANIRGPQGPAGTGVQYKGSEPTLGDFPSTGNVDGDMWIDESTGHAHIWENGSWIDAGRWLGPQGGQGIQGVRGSRWYVGTGAPTTIAGEAANDFYLNATNGDVYQFT